MFRTGKEGAGGWAIEAGNIKAGGGTTISDNIVADDNQHKNAAIKLETDGGATNASEGVGINDLAVERNIVYKWYQGLSIASGYTFGASGNNALNDVVVSDNDFQNTDSQKIINQPQGYNAAEEDWSGNRYFNTQSTSGWFNLGGSTTSFDKWRSTV